MVIFIGGASCVGKTALAQELLCKIHFPYLSQDHLKMGFIRGWKDCPFKATDSSEKIAEILWPITAEICKTTIENKQNIIIEGCYLPQKQVKELKKQYPDNIFVVYLVFSQKYIENNITDIIGHRNVIEKRLSSEERSTQEIIKENNEVKEACKKYGLLYFEIKNEYDKERTFLINTIINKVV